MTDNNLPDTLAESISSEPIKTLSRRFFIAKGIMAAGSMFVASGLHGKLFAANKIRKSTINIGRLKSQFKGELLIPSDSGFKKVVYDDLWNKLAILPARSPQLVACVKDEQDVIAAIKFAQDNKLKVAVRGGGHNWCSPSVRNGGIMIDLSNLNKVISIDETNKKAVTQPIVSNREMQAQLNRLGLSFPTGHCPPVKLSGYLLSGGMAWNQGVWGPGVGSVEALEMVTPKGELITASENENVDYYWAARGAGPGMFAVITRYHLKLYPLPKKIGTSIYYYPYENTSDVAGWLGLQAKNIPSNVELSIFILAAPPELKDKCKASAGKVCLVTATAFADSENEAISAMSSLEDCPLMNKCLSKSINQFTNFEALFDASGALWPGNLRNRVDALFSNAKLPDLMKSVHEHFLGTPSAKTIVMFAIFTGQNVPAPLPQNASFSMSARFYGGVWTMWDEASDDSTNLSWHEKCVQLLKPYISGHYVAETDTVGHPSYTQMSYSAKNWARLAQLRKQYDPDGIFFNFSDGLS